MRQTCPVAHTSAWNGFWALLRHEDVSAVLKDYQTYTTMVQNVVPRVAFTGRRPPLHLDPPEHTVYRRILVPFFTPEKMARFEPAVRRVTVELLQPFIAAGGGDICAEFTHRLPGYVFAEFFNLSTQLSMAIREVTRLYDLALQEADDQLVKQTSLQLYDLARGIIELRKAEPMDPAEDMTSAFLAARDSNGEPLPEAMILGTIRQLIVVGMIAPSVFIGSVAIHLSEHPQVQAQLRGDRSLIPAAVEEYLRLFTPYRGFARTATRDVVIRGRTIKKDEPIALVYASANRDESVFPDGDQFILNRPNLKQHVAFGGGPHQCAGAPLARMMLAITLEELLGRSRHIEVSGPPRMTGWPEWGTLSAPLRIVPAS
ncbi:MAG: cytochrome P450 [Chloroflexi bacterium]|nr:cytochrome P450 [Chloroflexota bacterium]